MLILPKINRYYLAVAHQKNFSGRPTSKIFGYSTGLIIRTSLTFIDFSFNFSGWRNLTHFITLAQKYNLLVNIRIGPYMDAEFEFGGFPWWLLKYDRIKLREWNPT